ncbi:hypothetical protein [Chengkuizengella axinellae]|uniref:Uncharacterized protein n=1 Tax=Chengkuizengella axinellae TaxID=3064388 RepID=A0ABT9IU84_9BACL|nr:hypothetical protein [Chengkuizengella sp. 2205SS18-9]MDP5272883.1 hypothetical protein [Chengkuizengella sp. 2205SS18-9]
MISAINIESQFINTQNSTAPVMFILIMSVVACIIGFIMNKISKVKYSRIGFAVWSTLCVTYILIGIFTGYWIPVWLLIIAFFLFSAVFNEAFRKSSSK